MIATRSAAQVVAVFDLDGTITDCDTYVKFLSRCLAHRPQRLARSLHLPFAVALHKAGLYDNAWLKATFLRAIAGGYDQQTLASVVGGHLATIVNDHVRPAAREAIAEHRRAGHRLVLATASFDFYVEQLGQELGFDEVICTRAERAADQSVIGRIKGRNCYGGAKLRAVLDAIPDRHLCTLVAYTDHHSDWELLMESDQPVAVSPTPQLRRLAIAHGVEVRQW